MAKLELININKKFDDVTALNNVNIKLMDGELFVLFGASGAGKSTIINIISGIKEPDSGKVILDDKDITQFFPQQRDMSIAFENYILYPFMTVFQNLLFPLESPIRKMEYSKKEKEGRVKEIANMLDIGELLNRHPNELSGGQKQRVALGRTLVREPKVYLLDEPIAHLDAKLRHRMHSELRKIQLKKGITTLYATPDQVEALSMADRICVLNKGNIEQIGKPDDVYNNPINLYVATFICKPPMNIFDAECQGNGEYIFTGTSQKVLIRPEDQKLLKAKGINQKLKVGIRPVDVSLIQPEINDEHTRIQGKVVRVETIGQISIITVETNSIEVKAKISSDLRPELNTTVRLELRNDCFYFFDPATTLRIC